MEFDVIAVTETWIDNLEEAIFLNIENYFAEHFIRSSKGGGVTLYINKSCEYVRKNVHVVNAESLFVELKRNLMPFRILRQVYFTLINCHVNYCIEAWGTAYSSTLHPLIVLQKKAIRIMTFADYNAHTKELFKILDILPIHKLVFLQYM